MIARDALRAMRERAEAATEGPWHEKHTSEHGCVRIGDYGWITPGSIGPEYDMDTPQGHADAEFIAHARTDVPALVEVVEAVLALHQPHRTHNALSNPDFWYSVCLSCVGPDGDHALYPCPTVVATQKLEGR